MSRIRGFTLIEIMVVMLIIGLILGIALPSINFNSPEDQLKEETNRLAALIGLASQESILNSRIIGISTDSDEYQFLVLDNGKWGILEDKILTKHKLPDDMQMEVVIDDDSSSTSSGTKLAMPQITLMDSGEIDPPFVINIKSHATEIYFSLNGYANGKLETKKQGDDQ